MSKQRVKIFIGSAIISVILFFIGLTMCAKLWAAIYGTHASPHYNVTPLIR